MRQYEEVVARGAAAFPALFRRPGQEGEEGGGELLWNTAGSTSVAMHSAAGAGAAGGVANDFAVGSAFVKPVFCDAVGSADAFVPAVFLCAPVVKNLGASCPLPFIEWLWPW